MAYDERYEVQHADAERALRTIATLIGEHVPDGFGFTLLLFTFGEGGSMFYISNAQRADVVKSMREFIAKVEREES